MKLEFLNDISDGGRYPQADPDSLIRLYDFDVAEANELRQLIRRVIIHHHLSLDLASIPFIEPVNCHLVLEISDIDEGIYSYDNVHFICSVTIEIYEQMLFLMEPFCDKESNGYQWLYDLDVPIDFLFSPGAVGGW